MRSRITIDSMYHVYTQGQDLQDTAEVAVDLWESRLASIETAKRKQKTDKMLELANLEPHPRFEAFVRAIAGTAEARSTRKKSSKQRTTPVIPVPVPAVLQQETEKQRLTRNLDLQGIILGGLLEILKIDTPEDERLWLYAQTRLVNDMKKAGLPKQCDALVESFAKEGWDLEVLKQCVAWLNVGALNAFLAQVFAQLGKECVSFAEAEQAKKSPPKLTVAQAADLHPTRVLLRMLGIAGLRDLTTIPPDSPLEDALAKRLKPFVTPLGSNIANHHMATQLHGLYALYEKHGERAFEQLPLVGTQKQAARMYCRVIAFVQMQERAWTASARACLETEAMARADRRLKKNPADPGRWVDRARALSDFRNDVQGALDALGHVPEKQRDAVYARERAIILGKGGRLPEVLSTLDGALAKPDMSDPGSVAKLFCLRAEARLHAQDALGAWADARRATLVEPQTPHLGELNGQVLELLDGGWDKSLAEAMGEEARYNGFWLILSRARNALLHERWDEAARVKNSVLPKSPVAAKLAEQIVELAKEMSTFFAEQAARPVKAMPAGITPEMAELLRQNGWDPSQADLATIAEEDSDDE